MLSDAEENYTRLRANQKVEVHRFCNENKSDSEVLVEVLGRICVRLLCKKDFNSIAMLNTGVFI